METEIYESLGLSPNEAKMYESLIETGEASVSEIALSSGIHRRNAYDAIQRLIGKGLCFQIISSNENKYNAVDPDKLVELLGEKQQKLAAILPELKRKFVNRIAPEEVYIYRGLEGQKNIYMDLLRVGMDSYFIGAKGGWDDPRLNAARSSFFKEVKKKNITFFGLYDHEVRAKPEIIEHFNAKLKYRFLPKDYSTNSGIHVFGDYVITYTGLTIGRTSDKTVYFVIHSSQLAESYRTWFHYMWDQSLPPLPKNNTL